MPCDSSHCEATDLERSGSEIACLLGELEGVPFTKAEFSGYHSGVYGHPSRDFVDKLTAELCGKLTECEDVTKYSLEMQMWWRDHQLADQKKITDKKKIIIEAREKAEAMAKLTEHERKILGLRLDLP